MSPMRRLGRWMLNTLTVLSLLLCVTTVVAWVLSYAGPANSTAPKDGWNVRSGGGQLDLFHQQPPAPGLLLPPLALPATMKPGPSSAIHIFNRYPLGQFGTTTDYRWQTNATIRAFGVYVRYSFVAVVAALLAAFSALPAFLGRRRRARIAEGLCPTCRYDLTANVSGVCPECGVKIAEAK
jgi:hypothetical protein